jgi:hypothetical protein
MAGIALKRVGWIVVTVVAGVAVVAAALVGVSVSPQRRTFDVRVVPRLPLPLAVCLSRERAYYPPGDSLIQEACRPGHATWYHAVVSYRGDGTVFVGCTLVGYDASGRRLWPGAWGMPMEPVVPQAVAATVRMRPGQTVTVDYHLPGVSQGGPPGPVAHFVAHCQTLAGEPL